MFLTFLCILLLSKRFDGHGERHQMTTEYIFKITKEIFMNNNMNTLTSLEYAGIESLIERIVSAYEDSFSIPYEEQTPVSEITRRTADGIEIFDGAYDAYVLDDFVIKELTYQDGLCELKGFFLNGRDIEDCEDDDYMAIDISILLDEAYINLDWLMEQINQAIKKENK